MNIIDKPVTEKYLISITWSLQMLSGVFYYPINCTTITERIVSFLFVILGIIINSYIISNITLIMTKVNIKNQVYNEKEEILDMISQYVKMP